MKNQQLRFKYISILLQINKEYNYNYYKHLKLNDICKYLITFLYKLNSIIKIQKMFRKYIINKNNKLKKQINNLIKNNKVIINLQKEIFKKDRYINDLHYKINEYKKQINILTNKTNYNICNNNQLSKSTYINYHKISKLSINQLRKILIDQYNYKYNDIKGLSIHTLKQYINRNCNDKYNRLFNNI